MIEDKLKEVTSKQNLKTVGVVKNLSLNLVEKFRKMRESNYYALRYYCRPKLSGKVSKIALQ